MEKTNIIMSEKEFVDWGKQVVIEELGTGNGSSKVLDLVKEMTYKLDELAMKQDESINNFTGEDYKVLAHFANITRMAAKCELLTKEEAAKLNAIQLGLLFIGKNPLAMPAVIDTLDPAFRPAIMQALEQMANDKNGGEE